MLVLFARGGKLVSPGLTCAEVRGGCPEMGDPGDPNPDWPCNCAGLVSLLDGRRVDRDPGEIVVAHLPHIGLDELAAVVGEWLAAAGFDDPDGKVAAERAGLIGRIGECFGVGQAVSAIYTGTGGEWLFVPDPRRELWRRMRTELPRFVLRDRCQPRTRSLGARG